jgi:hypothetical protein
MGLNRKTEILEMIGGIEDEKVLEQVYEILYAVTSTIEGGVLESLTFAKKRKIAEDL